MSAATDHLVPGDARALSPAEFSRTAGLSEPEVHELEEDGLLKPADRDLRTALALREATRLRADFDLDLFTTGLLAGYIRKIHDLEDALRHEQAHGRTTAEVYTEVSFTAVELHRR